MPKNNIFWNNKFKEEANQKQTINNENGYKKKWTKFNCRTYVNKMKSKEKEKEEEAKKGTTSYTRIEWLIPNWRLTMKKKHPYVLWIVDCESNTAHRTANTAYVNTNESNDKLKSSFKL